MPKLILVKHAKPVVTPGVPSEQWSLGDEGKAQALQLAEKLRAHGPQAVVASEEPKAAETGRIVANALKVPFSTAPDLHEHDRSNVPHMQTREFISYMALLFKKPGERVLGRESAAEARKRFEAALEEVAAVNPGQTLAVITHGTVIALHVAALNGEDAFGLWRRMGLPSFVVLEGERVDEVVEKIG
jgi:broad specificity phosphatase PhoE